MKSAQIIDSTTNQIGQLKGYCKKCGLMLIKGDRNPCPKCGSSAHVQDAPKPASNIHAVGYTRFTQFTSGNEKT